MISFLPIRTFWERISQGIPQDPMRDWLTLLTVSAIILTGIIVWNVWAFETVARGGTIGAPPVTTPELVDRAVLGTIQTIFEERAAEEAKYVTGVYRYTDPSQ